MREAESLIRKFKKDRLGKLDALRTAAYLTKTVIEASSSAKTYLAAANSGDCSDRIKFSRVWTDQQQDWHRLERVD